MKWASCENCQNKWIYQSEEIKTYFYQPKSNRLSIFHHLPGWLLAVLEVDPFIRISLGLQYNRKIAGAIFGSTQLRSRFEEWKLIKSNQHTKRKKRKTLNRKSENENI